MEGNGPHPEPPGRLHVSGWEANCVVFRDGLNMSQKWVTQHIIQLIPVITIYAPTNMCVSPNRGPLYMIYGPCASNTGVPFFRGTVLWVGLK